VLQIDYAAVGKCEGISEKQARRRFYWLKSQISSHENDATRGAGTEAEKQGQQDNQDGNDAKENI
jgi:Holliday junction resolvasome RuvABC DNA-binding subunit